MTIPENRGKGKEKVKMTITNLQPDKVLIFDIQGPMAHFRKYYTSSGASLSYLFPPKTVIVGIIAGLLGIPSERFTSDTENMYYDRFTSKNSLVAISIRSKIRQLMQKVNYVSTKSLGKIDGSAGQPTQIPLEILRPENDKMLLYRIYFFHLDKIIYQELRKRLKTQNFAFPPYFGLSEFLATIKYIAEGIISVNPSQNVNLNCVAKLSDVILDFNGTNLQYFTEKMPTGFKKDRIPESPDEYVLEKKGQVMKVKINKGATCYSVKYEDNNDRKTENIIFL